MTEIQYPLLNNRTLEVTVGLLVDAVNKHYDVDRVLADFGIRILGRVNYTSLIPGFIDPINNPFTGGFGDAYLVSQGSNSLAPYDVYIWTRKTPESVEGDGYWLDIGLLSTVGPQGPQGIPGPVGPQGLNTRWYIFTTLPQGGNYKPGDLALLPNGNVYMYVSLEYGWSNASQVNIKGPTGSPGRNGLTPYIGPDGNWWIGIQSTGVRAEGRDGANGVPGTAILIQGKLNSVDLLPDAATAPRNYGYLITVNGVVRLYFIAGMEGEESWQYIEYSGNGTIVTTNGVAQSTWDTNTKVDKTTQIRRIYGTDDNGNQTVYYSSKSPGGGDNAVPLRTIYGNIRVPIKPGQGMPDESEVEECATSKKYVDNLAATKVNKTTTPWTLYGTDSTGKPREFAITGSGAAHAIPQCNARGALQTYLAPEADNELTNKKYVDDAIAAAGGGDYEVGVVVKSAHGAAAVLNVSDLVDIVPNTTVQINVDVDMSDITMGPPGYDCYIGSTDVGLSQNQYYGFPVMTNNYNLYSCHVTCTGTNFKAVPIDQQYGSVATGTSFKCGVYSNGAGTNTITATYIKHK